jgi:hypothetical protein
VHKKYLGDSYDLVKRFFSERLVSVGRLYALPCFIPDAISAEFELITGIPVLRKTPNTTFGILLDPDTGIPLPGASATCKHASLEFIVKQERTHNPAYIVCFDQSHHRGKGLGKSDQRAVKQKFLREQGLSSFYYASHAPFLFIAAKVETIDSIFELLVSAGIPEHRLERLALN